MKLQPKAFDVLSYLAERPGQVVSQDELLNELWPGTFVQPEVIKSQILSIRTALDDRSSSPRYIETVRGRGYRFIGEIQPSGRAASADHLIAVGKLVVGRSAQLQELERSLAKARLGEAQFIFMIGEAGAGKTLLVEIFSNSAALSGATVAKTFCPPGPGQSGPYDPFVELLTSLSRRSVHGPVLAEPLPQLAPSWMALTTTPKHTLNGMTPHIMVRELCDLFETVAKEKLLVLILEDIDWADQATLDLVNAFATRRLRAKLLILATLRGATVDGRLAARELSGRLTLYGLADEISLPALSREDVRLYLSGGADDGGGAVPDLLTSKVHLRSGGNPLFMRSIIENLTLQGLATRDESGWHLASSFAAVKLPVPPDLARVIEMEISQLPAQIQAVIDAASLLDGPFMAISHHPAAAMDIETFEACCEMLNRRGQLIRRCQMVALPGTGYAQSYAFRHELFHDVASERHGAERGNRRRADIVQRLLALFPPDTGSCSRTSGGGLTQIEHRVRPIRSSQILPAGDRAA